MRRRAGVVCAALFALAATARGQTWGERVRNGWIVVDETPARFRISVPPTPRSNAEVVYGSIAALRAWDPSYAPMILSASALGGTAKRFDDRLKATIDLLAQRGNGGAFLGKAKLLERLAGAFEKSAAADPIAAEALAQLEAARILGGLAEASSATPRAAALIAEFDANPLASKPIGIHASSPELSRIFRQDRFLQRNFSTGRPESAWLTATAKVIADDPTLARAYESMMALTEITNRLAVWSLRELPTPEHTPIAFLPACRSHDTRLLQALYGSTGIPQGRAFMDDFIGAIRDGRVDLTPSSGSGWYDWQTWSLEPLIRTAAAPEVRKLQRADSYARYCEEGFKSRLTTQRETHIKDLFGGVCTGPGDPTIAPSITVEPQISLYRRTADSYRFLRGALERVLGREMLSSEPLVNAEGEETQKVWDALVGIERQFREMAALAAHETGADPALVGDGITEVEALALAQAGQQRTSGGFSEAELAYDPRVIVPIADDQVGHEIRCWAVIGVVVRNLKFEYVAPPRTRIVDAETRRATPRVELDDITECVPSEVWIECSLKQPLTREEFRALCDRYRTAAKIRQALNAVR